MVLNILTLITTVLKWKGNRFPLDVVNFNKLFNHENGETLAVIVRNSPSFQLFSGNNNYYHRPSLTTEPRFEHSVTCWLS